MSKGFGLATVEEYGTQVTDTLVWMLAAFDAGVSKKEGIHQDTVEELLLARVQSWVALLTCVINASRLRYRYIPNTY